MKKLWGDGHVVTPDPGEKYKLQQPKEARRKRTGKKPLRRSLPLPQLLHLLHRFLVFIAAVLYAALSLTATLDALKLLDGDVTAFVSEGPYASDALAAATGSTTIRDSPLVVEALQNDTSPRNGTLYFDASGSSSFHMCDTIAPKIHDIYTAEYLRSLYATIVRDASYNLTFLAERETELVVPVVDCTGDLVADEDETIAQFYFLVRKRSSLDDVYMVTITFANQGYEIPMQNEYGPAGVATLTFINDLQADSVDCYYIMSIGYPYQRLDFRVYEHVGTSDDGLWMLRTIPNGDASDLAKLVYTGTQSGFYSNSDTSQANIYSELWIVPSTPVQAITGSEWLSKSVLYDSWAWVHFLQLLFAVDLLSSLMLLVMVSYRNFVAGKLWIGDAFVTVASRATLRGVLVLVSWYINGFWALLEFCIFDANNLTELTNIKIHSSILCADLQTIYFSICALLGAGFRERVDPLLAMICFHIGFQSRKQVIQWFPEFVATVNAFYAEFYNLGMPDRLEGQTRIAPMRFWSLHKIDSVPAELIFATLMPIFSTLVFLLAFIASKKAYRYFVPDPLRKSGQSDAGNVALARDQTRGLTLFEIATGAKLANKFGLLAEYDNCLYIKGMKFASADGIYSNGFVIANRKYLVQVDDIWLILLMKLTRVRYKNIYMYDVNGNTVEQMARLVYPDTLSMRDLLNLNTNILS